MVTSSVEVSGTVPDDVQHRPAEVPVAWDRWSRSGPGSAAPAERPRLPLRVHATAVSSVGCFTAAVEWPLLGALGEAERAAVLAAARRRTFARGEVVFHEEDPADSLHLVVSGHLAVRVG